MRPPAMRLLALMLLPPLLGGCGAAIQIAVQAATEMTVRSVHYAIVSGSRENAIRNYADVGFKAERPDAIRPAEDAAVWLRANRETFEQQVAAYNKAHDLARGPGDSGGERVTDVHAVDWILLSDARLDKLSAVTEFRVGTRDFVTANKTFVLQWQGEGLAIVDHLGSDDTTLAAYLGLPPSPPDPLAVAKGGDQSPGAITAAPPVLATQPGSTASAGTTTSGTTEPAFDPAASQATFDAWLAENRDVFVAQLQRQLTAWDHRNHTNCAQAVTKVYDPRVLERRGELYTVALSYDTRCTVGWQGSYSFQETFQVDVVDGMLKGIALASAAPAAPEPTAEELQAAAQVEFDAWLADNREILLREVKTYVREADLHEVTIAGGSVQTLQSSSVVRRDGDSWVIDVTYYLYRASPSAAYQSRNYTDRFHIDLDGDRLVGIKLAS